MIKFTNNYFENGKLDEQDLINDITACRILMKGFKECGDKVNEAIIRIEFAKRKAFAINHNIDYNPDKELVKIW